MAGKRKVTSLGILQGLGSDDSSDCDSQDSLLAYESEPHNEQEETQSDTPAQTAATEQTSNNDDASQSAANTYQPAIEHNTSNGDNEHYFITSSRFINWLD